MLVNIRGRIFFQVGIQKFKDYDIENYKFASIFMGVKLGL